MTPSPTRRTLLTAALATGLSVPLHATGPASAAPRLALPVPTGPHPVGTVDLHVEGPAGRALPVSLWYPAAPGAGRYPVASWLAAAPMRALLAANGLPPGLGAPRTAGHRGAPVLRTGERRPVVVYSHSADGHRSETTIMVQELASHGCLAGTVDHADSYGLGPGGELVIPDEQASVTPWDHARDVRAVLDRIGELAAGHNPDIERRRLPAGLGAAIDPHRIGMTGWSKGGTATALVMNEDRRVRAGLSLDGPMQAQPPVAGLDRPFMLMTAEFTRDAEAGVAEFWEQLRGWRLDLRTDGAPHLGYSDYQWLLPQIGAILGWDDAELAGWVGSFDPAHAVRVQQTYPLAFFDRHLRHRRSPLLTGPNPEFPEVHVTIPAGQSS
ncbi:lipase [Actinoplanes sp. N902-109]|uniref:alpha/beta hydrolase n=1 Tax=Actinoplanes sp. (strain N902-109) TaxID=649831 RepID=UPI0003294328|nr:lipase [Actinoplanes sp. N902-109]AGL17569.1 lipase [Actinoplanes sp. N902-109]